MIERILWVIGFWAILTLLFWAVVHLPYWVMPSVLVIAGVIVLSRGVYYLAAQAQKKRMGADQ